MGTPQLTTRVLPLPKSHPCRSRGIRVLVEDSAQALATPYIGFLTDFQLILRCSKWVRTRAALTRSPILLGLRVVCCRAVQRSVRSAKPRSPRQRRALSGSHLRSYMIASCSPYWLIKPRGGLVALDPSGAPYRRVSTARRTTGSHTTRTTTGRPDRFKYLQSRLTTCDTRPTGCAVSRSHTP
jgi:hypothetical protein